MPTTAQVVSEQPKGELKIGDPGTCSHIASNIMIYSFKARMVGARLAIHGHLQVGTGLMNQPPTTDTGYRPTGCAMCLCNICPCSMCCCTGKV